MNRFLSLIAVAAVLGGCATQKPLYGWGSYEDLIYASYVTPDKIPPQSQVDLLEKDFQEARGEDLRMPPGWHAQLGYLYSQLGRTDQARQELMTEKAQFPESAVFMDRLLTNLKTP